MTKKKHGATLTLKKGASAKKYQMTLTISGMIKSIYYSNTNHRRAFEILCQNTKFGTNEKSALLLQLHIQVRGLYKEIEQSLR